MRIVYHTADFIRNLGEACWSRQFNVVSRETLLDAQISLEKHRDLIVRVAGYSAYFNDLLLRLYVHGTWLLLLNYIKSYKNSLTTI